MFYKTDKEKCFAYSVSTACDDNNFILGFDVTVGNVHDSVAFDWVHNSVIFRLKDKIIAIAVDAGYVTPHIAKTIFDSNLQQLAVVVTNNINLTLLTALNVHLEINVLKVKMCKKL